MSNMSYVRWENTLHDLEDCAQHVIDMLEKSSECEAHKELLMLAAEMLREIGVSMNHVELNMALKNLSCLDFSDESENT